MYVIFEKKFLLIFIRLSQAGLVDVYARFSLLCFLASLHCFALYYTVLYCLSGE